MTQLTACARPLLLVIVTVVALGWVGAQSNSFWSWSADGLEFLADGVGNSIRSVMEEHFPRTRYMFHLPPEELSVGDAAPSVIFRWLTDKPLVVLSAYPERAAAYIRSFDLRGFLNGWRLRFQLEYALTGDVPVADLEILNALGAPSNRMTETGPLGDTERREYNQYRLVLYFRRGPLNTVTTY